MLKAVVEHQEVYLLAIKLVDNRLVQISALVDASVVHITVSAAVRGLGSD